MLKGSLQDDIYVHNVEPNQNKYPNQ